MYICTFNKIFVLLILAFSLSIAGCATHTGYLQLDPVVQKDIRTFGGTPYVPLMRVCDAYGLKCTYDTFVRTAVISGRSGTITLRAGGTLAIVNGTEKSLNRPVLLEQGLIFVPVSFVRSDFGSIMNAAAVQTQQPQPAKAITINTVVLDPGHGGRDAGALGRRYRLKEKDAALSIARNIKAVLESHGLRVIMTRDDDRFIPLAQRVEIADKNKADLFVSVHINASRTRTLNGFECYYLSDATDDNAMALEAIENAYTRIGEGAQVEHSKPLDKTLWDMTLTENRAESAELAGSICNVISKSAVTKNRGIRSARFFVLKNNHIPSVLVEVGYISNRYEEKKILDPEFHKKIADKIAAGILAYKAEYERTQGLTNLR